MREDILSQILALKEMKSEELLTKHKEVFDGQHPSINNAKYLRKKISYRIQEIAHGGLSEDAKTRLEQLITVYDPINNRLLRKTTGKESGVKIKRDRRLPIPGSIITKIYKGVEIKVKVHEKGFEYDGKPYRTLSQVANVLTGNHWNGYLFFNL
jgi:hypothetical protein|tara:strand:- start:1966 stop:2427 length:462 start_codon:yes stop_codon:yes gene_type:complete